MSDDLIQFVCGIYAEAIGTCPYDMHDYQPRNCESDCQSQYADCWRIYFEKEFERIRKVVD